MNSTTSSRNVSLLRKFRCNCFKRSAQRWSTEQSGYPSLKRDLVETLVPQLCLFLAVNFKEKALWTVQLLHKSLLKRLAYQQQSKRRQDGITFSEGRQCFASPPTLDAVGTAAQLCHDKAAHGVVRLTPSRSTLLDFLSQNSRPASEQRWSKQNVNYHSYATDYPKLSVSYAGCPELLAESRNNAGS